MSDLLVNKKARLNYEIIEEFFAGIVLHGFEVKSLRRSHGSISESFITCQDGEAYLVKAHIPAYQPSNTPTDYDPYRKRKILLKSAEIRKLIQKQDKEGLTLVPLAVISKSRLLKLRFALARGKKKHDKRETIKKRDQEREIGRKLKK